jgi:hypothetical protein
MYPIQYPFWFSPEKKTFGGSLAQGAQAGQVQASAPQHRFACDATLNASHVEDVETGDQNGI